IVEHVLGEVCVPKVPQRLITLDETTLGDALALGIPSIGFSSYDELANYLVKQIGDLEFLGKSDKPSLEKIYQLNPDLILGADNSAESIYRQLSQIAPTALGEWNGYPSWREYFDFVARVLGKEDKANAVWSDYNRRIEELKTAVGNNLQDLEISLAYACCGTITMDAENSFAGSILADLGIRRPKSQVIGDGIIPLSEERLSDLDGDILFMSVYDQESKDILTDWQQKPLWNQLQVVQNKRVHVVDAGIWRAGDPLAANLVIDDLYKYLVEQP
ncbi:MAG: iron-siderophore ABC transporter substrate-binding protein, partial [Cyanobacteria bacterium J06638_38]